MCSCAARVYGRGEGRGGGEVVCRSSLGSGEECVLYSYLAAQGCVFMCSTCVWEGGGEGRGGSSL